MLTQIELLPQMEFQRYLKLIHPGITALQSDNPSASTTSRITAAVDVVSSGTVFTNAKAEVDGTQAQTGARDAADKAVKDTKLESLTMRLQRHSGLYLDKSYAPELKNVLLLTAANSGYLEMLTNWECIAKRLGLDWMVISIDSDLHQHLGERSISATGQEWQQAEGFFSKVGFRVIACNKIRTVADVLRATSLDIVFSDSDNVFKSDPFLPSLTLGNMIRSGKYEYIYGRKIEPGNQKIQNFNPDAYHQEPIKANTGFYYVAGGRKQKIVQQVFDKGVKWCNDRPHMDDQENFWDALVDTRRKKKFQQDYLACFRHCNSSACDGVEESQVFNYCDMSPWEYVLGCFTPASVLEEPRMVSYHATHVVGWQSKRKKLQMINLWAYCNETEVSGSPQSPILTTAAAADVVSSETVFTNAKAEVDGTQAQTGVRDAADKAVKDTKVEPLSMRLQRHSGLYLDKSYAPELKNVLLLTAANSGYLEMLTNWECIAKRLGLDWMVISIDSDLHQHLGERSISATGQEWQQAEGFFSKVGFRVIACNKIRTVADVLRATSLDIVFSDSDNVFKSDPFLPSLTLGNMIRSGKYEYIYGRKIEPGNQKIQNFNPDAYHQEPIKANTGFYYVAGGRKQKIVQQVFDKGVKWCNDRPHMDDQENFWDALVDTRRKKKFQQDYLACFRHCNSSACDGVEESQVFNYCDMSPWEYVLGCFTPASVLEEPRMVSYHATHVVGWQSKRKKLQMVNLWAYCNETEVSESPVKGPK